MDDDITGGDLTAADEASDADAGKRMGMAAIIITAFLMLGKIMGYGKEMVLAWALGASRSTDAFKVAYNSVIFTIYTKVEKLLRPTYLPEFVKVRRERGEEAAWQVASVITGIQFLLLTALAGICIVFARPILVAVGKGLTDSPEDLERGVVMMRIMAPALLLFSLSVMPELTLHAYKRFTLPAVAEAAFRTGVVVVFVALLALVWPDHPPDSIYAIAFGVLVGGCLRFLVQVPGLRGKLRMFRFSANVWRSPGARAVIALMPPVVVGVIFSTLRTWADSRFGSDIGAGVYTCLDFARKIPDLLLQTLPLAVSFVVYPYLSEWALRGEKDKMADALVATTRALAFIFVPAGVALMIVALPVIEVIYQHGKFAGEQAELSALGVFWYSPGLLFFSLEGSINKWFFAFKDTATPNFVGASFAVLHILIGYIGVYHLGSTAKSKLSWIAAALTISKSAKVVTLYALIRRRIGRIDARKALAFCVKLAVSAALMALALWALQRRLTPALQLWEPPAGGDKARAIASLGASFGVGAVVFLAAAALTRIEELSMVTGTLAKGFAKISGKLRPPRGD